MGVLLVEHVALMQYQMSIFASCVFSCISAATFLVSPMVVNFPMYSLFWWIFLQAWWYFYSLTVYFPCVLLPACRVFSPEDEEERG